MNAHEHPHGLRHRGAHTFGHLLGAGHSHDPADQIDDALEANAAGRRALWISLAILVATAMLQAVVVLWSGSVALLGDTLHNVADALTAVPLLFAFALARRQPTQRYPYGYGRAEDLAGVFVVAMISLSAVLAGWQAIDRLIHPQQVTALVAVAGAGVVGFLGNEWVARYRISVGRRIGSAALVADGLHARTDGLTSLAVVLGAGGTAIGWHWADPVVGLLIAVAILGVLRSAAAQVGLRLMDGVDPELTRRAHAALAAVPEVAAVADLRLRWIGHTLRAEVVLETDPTRTVLDAQTVRDEALQALRIALPRLDGAVIELRGRSG
ncbi:MAG: cation transporter [Austwickia sp.]|jgi:cation diffusion facilitator family transporter|nr:cation transporter [Austwickia sp.]MBK8436885.1 cation transporter [Austwickia sp.]MBK9100512.1 cation transporter [Austwickia sp.]